MREHHFMKNFIQILRLSLALTLTTPVSQAATCGKHLARMDRRIVHRDPYRYLETNSDETRQWLSAQNDHTRIYFESEPEYLRHWKAVLYEHYNKPTTLQETPLTKPYSAALIDRGLNLPNEIVLKTEGREIRTLFSNHQINRDGSVGLTRFSVDPLGKYLLIPVVHSGSLDTGDLFIVNIETGEVVTKLENISDYGVTWINPHEFIYGRYATVDYVSYVHRVGTQTSADRRFESKDLYSNSPDLKVVVRKVEQQTALRFVRDTDEEILNLSLQEIIATSENALFGTVKDADGWTEVVRIAIDPSPSGKLKLGRHRTLNLRKGNLGPSFSNGKQTLLTFSLAASRWAILISEIGEIDRTIKLPNHSTLTDCEFLKAKKLKLSFTSPIVKKESFVYDLQTERFADSDEAIESKMLTDEKGHRYKTRYVEVESADKKKFPVRIVHRDDLDLDEKRPTLVEGYGGFNLAGYLDPKYRFEISQFLEDGGVYVAPALRGGNEMGPAWRKDAMFKHGTKMNTFNDMAATLRMLVAAKYSSPATIAIEGWSNGGYLVGAMITLFPDLFGLAIPGNGVHDQLRKQVLDPRFQGWEEEWGNPETDAKAFVQLLKISPVTLALKKRNYPATLVIAGEDDSRVNRAHSLKLAAALQNSQQNSGNPILLLAVPKSGHWVTKENLQDTLAYETQAHKWAMIYRRLGIKAVR